MVLPPPLSALVPFPINGRSSSQPTLVTTPGVAGRRQQTPVQPGRRGVRSSIFVPDGDPEGIRLTALPSPSSPPLRPAKQGGSNCTLAVRPCLVAQRLRMLLGR